MGDFQVLSLDFGRSCHPGILLSALVPQQLFNNNGPLRRGHTDYSAHGFSFRHKGHPCFSHSGTIHLLIISEMLLIFRDIFLSARISPTFAFNSNRTCVMHVAWSGQNHNSGLIGKIMWYLSSVKDTPCHDANESLMPQSSRIHVNPGKHVSRTPLF